MNIGYSLFNGKRKLALLSRPIIILIRFTTLKFLRSSNPVRFIGAVIYNLILQSTLFLLLPSVTIRTDILSHSWFFVTFNLVILLQDSYRSKFCGRAFQYNFWVVNPWLWRRCWVQLNTVICLTFTRHLYNRLGDFCVNKKVHNIYLFFIKSLH